MAIKSKAQLAVDIAASTFSAPQQVILDDIVDSYDDYVQMLTTVQRVAIASPATGLKVYDTTLQQLMIYNSVAWVPCSVPSTTPMVAKVTVSASDMATLESVPFEVIAAPGSGLMLVPTSIAWKNTFVTTAYDFSDELYFYFKESGSPVLPNYVSRLSLATANSVFTCSGISPSQSTQSPATDSTGDNLSLMLKTTANPTVGDGFLTLWITYSIVES